MSFCTGCGAPLDDGDRFCGKCGAPRGGPDVVSSATPARKKISRPKLIVGLLLSTVVWGSVFMFIFNSDGCSSTEGALEVEGKPHGDLQFTPAVCKSGEHESFYGVYLLGDNANAGGVKIVIDPREGAFAQFEVPGTCDGAGKCTVVELGREQCERFEVDIRKTDTYVNEIRLLDGRLGLKCSLTEGGSLQGDISFESCD